MDPALDDTEWVEETDPTPDTSASEGHYRDLAAMRVHPAHWASCVAVTESMRRAELEALTLRESEVCELVVAGKSNRQIAARLAMSVKTVQTHRAKINRKFGVHRTPELMVLVSKLRGAA